MALFTYDQLRERLITECRSRKWRPPSRERLKKLRDSGQLPKATPRYEKGHRGRTWLYEASTVTAYVRAEELRRASGKRVRSWKLVAQREKTEELRTWLARPDGPVPRNLMGDALEEFAGLFRRIAAAVYGYVERPVGPDEDDRLEGAHTAIETMLDGSTLRGEWRDTMTALLQMLVFRDEEGNSEDFDMAELLEPIRQRAGPFGALSGLAGIRRIVAETQMNEILTHPRSLMDEASDEELRVSARMTSGLFAAVERLANVASVVLTVVRKAAVDERTRGDVRIDWCRTIAEGATGIANFLQSDFAPSILCACTLANVSMIRRDPEGPMKLQSVTEHIANFAAVVEDSSFAKKKPVAALNS